MSRLIASLLTALFPYAASGQDIGKQFTDAVTVFGTTADMAGPARDRIEALVPTLAGTWVDIALLLDGAPTDGSIETDMSAWCGGIVQDLRPAGRYGFDLTRRNLARPESPAITVRYGYVGGTLFQRFVDETELLTAMGFVDGRDPPPGMMATMPGYDRVRIIHPSPDIIVFLTDRGGTEYLARCR